MQPLQNFCIPVVQPLCLCAVEIPEAEIRQNTCLLRRMGKRRAACQIRREISRLIRLKAVQADRNLAQRGRSKQRFLLFGSSVPFVVSVARKPSSQQISSSCGSCGCSSGSPITCRYRCSP